VNTDNDFEAGKIHKEGVVNKYLQQIAEKMANPRSKIYQNIQNAEIIVRPPDPVKELIKLKPSAFRPDCLRPDPFYLPDVFIWAPHLCWDISWLKCNCGNNMSPKGWQSNPSFRKVVGIDACFYMASYVYHCSCGKTCYGSSPDVLNQAPTYIQRLFPATLTKRLAVSNQVRLRFFLLFC
jgi:hypothetical protein